MPDTENPDFTPENEAADERRLFGPLRELRETLALTSGALQCVAHLLPAGERHIVNFTGEWQHIGPQSIKAILDRANAALEPKAEG